MTFHPVPGTSGCLTALAFFLVLFGIFMRRFAPGPYTFNAGEEPGAFDPHLSRYVFITQVIIGLSVGSILLVVNGLKDASGQVHWYFASPLVMLSMCIIYGTLFMAFLVFFYEEFQHHPERYSKGKHCLVNALGFACLCCFAFGFLWLTFAIGANR